MRREQNIFYNIDWVMVGLYVALVLIGWINIYAAVYNEEHRSIFDISQNYGRQLVWIVTSVVLALFILAVDAKFYNAFSFILYLLMLVLLVAVLFLGKEISGAKAWFQLGSFSIQPSEFAKVTTALALARYMGTMDINLKSFRTQLNTILIIGIPVVLILLENDTGTALMFAGFVIVLFREGISNKIMLTGLFIIVLSVLSLVLDHLLLIGILAVSAIMAIFIRRHGRSLKKILIILGLLVLATGYVFAVDLAFDNLLEEHQQNRVKVLLGIEDDPRGIGYNVNQSKIAIGSGGFFGKGFLQGTQTKFDFVPAQSTDFIFCTVGEEWGFLGSTIVVGLYVLLIVRIILKAERQRTTFSRIYGYGVASILFTHFAINIGMTIGVAPVIGIPLPFLSYGGSSLWAFTIMLFIFIKLDIKRLELI
ncbi:MAG TPA: rod shape-determining protein RodA [Bacteroidales bacterium]|nr:rod shape-determining protein RodA [Bacteroidales bacterium]HNS46416.1 rod shape-determining protein RodA [Bacteroidales bacterium]